MTNAAGKLILPPNPHLDFLRRAAKRRLTEMRAHVSGTQLSEAQLELARDYGFSSWRSLKAEVESRITASDVRAMTEAEAIARRRAEQALPRKAIPIDPRLFDSYIGYYQLGPSAIFTITRDGAHFYLQLTGQVSVEIFPERQHKFFAEGVPAQVSFIVDQQGRVTELVLHQAGAEQHAKRIDAALAEDIRAKLEQRRKNNTPSPGTEAALRRHIEGLENGHANFDIMSSELAALTRQQMPLLQQYMKRWGTLKSLTFKAVSRQGWDIYEGVFERGRTEWRITPVRTDGTVSGLGVRELP